MYTTNRNHHEYFSTNLVNTTRQMEDYLHEIARTFIDGVMQDQYFIDNAKALGITPEKLSLDEFLLEYKSLIRGEHEIQGDRILKAFEAFEFLDIILYEIQIMQKPFLYPSTNPLKPLL